MDKLNEQQRRAVTFGGKHLLVLAGAGTGKTRTIISRAKYLIESGVQPNRILILSFTRKSANEIVNRIALETDQSKCNGLSGQTFHSWCMSLIKNNPNVFPQANYTLMDEDDQVSLMKLICGRTWNLKDDEGKKIKADAILDVYSYAVNAKCALSDAIRMVLYDNASVDKDVSKENEALKIVIQRYLKYKTERKYLDYDDLLLVISKSLIQNPELRKAVTGLYDHILIDEMQDTNPLQYELLSSFYEDCHLFCVGDDAQSIYAFRGADFKTVHHFAEVVPGAETKKLTINYRSTSEILDLSNWILDQSPLNYDKQLESFRGPGIKPQIIHWDSEWDEARDIVNKIKDSRPYLGLNWKDHLVLSRSRWTLRKVEGLLIKEKIPYVLFGGTGLMGSMHIRDLVSALRVVANFLDEIAWRRYLQLWAGIGDITAASIIDQIVKNNSLEDVIEMFERQGFIEDIPKTLRNICHLQSNPSKAISEAYKSMETMFEQKYTKMEDSWRWRKEDFPLLEEIAKDCGTISEFVAEYVLDPKLETTRKSMGKDVDHVVLSTIHSAKGLEADSVYLIDASVKNFPTPRAILNGEDAIEEERRCLYVALTRAQNRLFIYRNIQSIHLSEGEESKKYFLNSIPVELYDNKTIAKNVLHFERFLRPIRPNNLNLYSDFNYE